MRVIIKKDYDDCSLWAANYVAYKIKAFRKANNLTQEQLADKMNCNFKTIGNLENDRTMPDLKQVINLCDVLNVSMDELFAGTLSKTENFIEPSEDDEGYPKFVSRRISAFPSNHLQRLESMSIKMRSMNEKELNIVEAVIDSVIGNR